MIERRADGQASRQTDRQTDRQMTDTDRQTCMQASKDRKRVVNHLVRCFRESVIQQADYYVNVKL